MAINSIYDDISEWSNNRSYYRFEPTFFGGNFYYAKEDHTVAPAGSFDSAKWEGIVTRDNQSEFFFPWPPGWSSSSKHSPKVNSISFNDGYQQRSADGLDNDLIELELVFDGRKVEQSVAILHFLHKRAGATSFLFVPPAPYATEKRFICPEFSTRFIFYNNNDIQATFREVVN